MEVGKGDASRLRLFLYWIFSSLRNSHCLFLKAGKLWQSCRGEAFASQVYTG